MSGTLADWIVAFGTLVLAGVAVFQDTIRGWFYGPKFEVTVRCTPPDCVSVPFTNVKTGEFLAQSIYLRVLVKNVGNLAAKNVEVYAERLRRKRADNKLELVKAFPPMNLRWADVGGLYFPIIVPQMGKHCDIGHITDPVRRHLVGEDNPMLKLTAQECCLVFDLMVAPNHRGHIIGPGEYILDILIAAENAKPLRKSVGITMPGPWNSDETIMLRDGIGMQILG